MFQDPTFWVAVAFVITVAAVFKPIARTFSKLLDDRILRIRQQLDEAQELREEAQKVLAEYKRMQRDAVGEAERILVQAKQEAQHLREQAERDLEAQLARREKLALEKIEQAEANALQEVRDRTVDIAIAASAKLLADKIDESKAESLIDDAIKELPDQLH